MLIKNSRSQEMRIRCFRCRYRISLFPGLSVLALLKPLRVCSNWTALYLCIPDINKQNESWKSGQRRLWNLMNIWKLHAICNGRQKHIRSNLMIMTKKHCGSHPLISCLWHFCWESAHRNHNGYKGRVYSPRLPNSWRRIKDKKTLW